MLDESLSAYFVAVRSLRSTDPAVRRPAVSALLGLARGSRAPVKARAERVLIAEFGPFAVTEGLSGCAASAEGVFECCAEGRDCQGCVWLWEDEPPPELTDFDAWAAFGRGPL